jgi:hypothetical protein
MARFAGRQPILSRKTEERPLFGNAPGNDNEGRGNGVGQAPAAARLTAFAPVPLSDRAFREED